MTEYNYRSTVNEVREWLAQFAGDEEVFIGGTKTSGYIMVEEKQFSLYDEPEEN